MKYVPLKALCLLLAPVLLSCEKTDTAAPAPFKPISQSQYSADYSYEKMMVLGEKLDNPFLATTLEKAEQNLGLDIDTRVNHLYVRFLPANRDEYEALEADERLELYDHPLDYEILSPGTSYHDPTLPDSSYTWQYCAVKADYKFPEIKYEILAELSIPNEAADDQVARVVDEAFRLTGNDVAQDSNPSDGGGTVLQPEGFSDRVVDAQQAVSSCFTPAGRIRVLNKFKTKTGAQISQMIGFEGIQIRARRWFTTYTAITDANGYYRMNNCFRNPANYSLKYERPNFDLVDASFFGQITIDGPKQSSDWNVDISSGNQLYYATIFRGAFDYYYNNHHLGIRTPPVRNNIFQSRVTLLAKYRDNDAANANFSPWRQAFLFPDIVIFNPNRDSDEIYSTTVHELAHASHYERTGFFFIGVADRVIESWGRAVQYYFTNWRFRQYVSSTADYDWSYGYQYVQKGPSSYTPMFIDLIDDFNQMSGYPGYYNFYQDPVSGYTLRQLEDALDQGKTVGTLKTTLQSRYGTFSNGSNAQLDYFFSGY